MNYPMTNVNNGMPVLLYGCQMMRMRSSLYKNLLVMNASGLMLQMLLLKDDGYGGTVREKIILSLRWLVLVPFTYDLTHFGCHIYTAATCLRKLISRLKARVYKEMFSLSIFLKDQE